MTFFEPSPILIAFIFVQRLVFFEVLGLLAFLRLLVGKGVARLPAALALVICAVAVFATFAPAFNLHTLPIYPAAARLLAAGGGVVLPIATSAIFAVSLLMPSRKWRWIDLVHCAGMLAFLGLWAVTRV